MERIYLGTAYVVTDIINVISLLSKWELCLDLKGSKAPFESYFQLQVWV